MKLFRRRAPLILMAGALAMAGGGALYAQLEGAERGVPPIDSSSTLEVSGIAVDTTGKTSEEARLAGWRQAQRLGWAALWAKSTGRPASQAPDLTDAVLNTIVAGIVVEQEQIGPTRYIAQLGILFDRARAGQMLGGTQGPVRRSAPMLVIPILQTGSTRYSFEFQNEWQKAWARFRTGGSAIDYIRPTGLGIDPLLLNAAQTRRPGRAWWRMILDSYGAADAVIPEVHLKRLYPGGPAIGTFTVRFGPDNVVLDRFTLRVENSGAIPRLLDEGVRRIDEAYTRALMAGMLTPDPSLIVEEPDIAAELAEQIEAATDAFTTPTTTAPVPVGVANSFNIQVDTPTAAAVSQAELSVSRINGVTSALTTSLALGGTSVMRVTFVGDSASLQAALQAQGWQVQGSGSTLRISRPGGQ